MVILRAMAGRSKPAACPRVAAKRVVTFRSSGKLGEKRKRTPEAFTPPQIKEALQLLSIQSHTMLMKKEPRTFRGAVTWTRLCDSTAHGIAQLMLHARSLDTLRDAIGFAEQLGHRLQQRDASRGARVTDATRALVLNVTRAATAVEELMDVSDGDREATLDTGGRAIALRGRWVRLAEALEGDRNNALVRKLVEDAVATVLKSGVHGGVKSLYSKALQPWVAPSPRASPPRDGVAVQWDSDDDF